MGRPLKSGLDYAPLDVDFFNSDEVRLLEANTGSRGILTYLKLRNRIFKNCYYTPFGESELCLFAKYEAGLSPGVLKKYLEEMIRLNLFDRHLFETRSILTSESIQIEYRSAAGKKTDRKLKSEYLLIDFSIYGHSNGVNSEKTPVNPENSPESRVEEIIKRVKEANNPFLSRIFSSEKFITEFRKLLSLKVWQEKTNDQIIAALDVHKDHSTEAIISAVQQSFAGNYKALFIKGQSDQIKSTQHVNGNKL